MMARLIVTLLLILPGMAAYADGIGFQRYYQQNEFSLTSPGAMKFGLYGYDNPAGLQYLHQGDALLQWTSDDILYDDQRWSAIFALPGFSFTLGRDSRGDGSVRDYKIAVGGGSDAFATGFSVGWYRGDTDAQDLQTHFTLGALSRPNRYTSFGITGTLARDTDYYETVLDMAYRPMGTPVLTLFVDYAVGNDNGWADGQWSAGAASEVLPGVRLSGRYFDDGTATAGFQFSMGSAGFSAQAHRPDNGVSAYQSYALRIGARDRSIFEAWSGPGDDFMELKLEQEMTYQRLGLFDRRQSLLDTLRYIDIARQDDSIGGIVVNTSKMQIPAAMVWELSSALNEFRDTGKRVVLYIENGGMTEFLLSSSADLVLMDPTGTLLVPGFVSGSTYLADLLDHWGVGVEEFRNLEYKTAFESVSSNAMSDADRQQRQTMIDSFYDLWQGAMQDGRGMTARTFDSVIDRGIYLSPQDLQQAGIVDVLGRYAQLDELLEESFGSEPRRVEPQGLRALTVPRDNHWGPSHRIAVVYATGMTDTDSGMRTRQLAELMQELREDDSIKAIVLRVDSPGGGILAADLLAQEVKKTQAEKPVVASLGSLATSGGYWVAMHAGTLVAAPNTVTGSIGVTGVRLWDDGLGERLRLNSDFVSRGSSADVMFGIGLPVAGMSLPHRPLTSSEYSGIMQRLDGLYDNFVSQAAQARGIPETELRELAAGRVYTGADALAVGLVDELGSLTFAIDLAAKQAGLTPNDKVTLVESPRAGISSLNDLRYLIDLEGSASSLFDADVYRRQYLEFLIEHRGQPMVLLPYEYFDGAVR